MYLFILILRIYTTMLGKKKSLIELKKYLLEKEITSFDETQFCQGNTMRWGLSWSLSEQIQLAKPKLTNKKISKQIQFQINLQSDKTMIYYYDIIKTLFLEELKLDLINQNKPNEMSFIAYENTWSNQRQKKRAKLSPSFDTNLDTQPKKDKKLIEFKIKLSQQFESKLNLELVSLTDGDSNKSEIKELLNQIQQFLRNKLSI